MPLIKKAKRQASWLFACLVMAALFIAALCSIADHIITSGTLAHLINSNTDDISVHYSSATGSILTRLRFKDLAVDGQDTQVKWKIRIKDALISPSIWRLPFKKFYTSILYGSGFSFHLEFKRHREHHRNDQSDEDGYKRNWRLRFGDIRLREITEITIGRASYRGQGQASLDAGFYFWPEYELQIAPSRFKTQDPFFETDFKFQVAHVRLKTASGPALLRALSSELKFKGQSDDLRFVNYYFRSAPWLKIKGSGARLEAFVKADNGIIAPESNAALTVKHLALKAGLINVIGTGELKFHAPKLDIHFSRYRTNPPLIKGDDLGVFATTHKIDLADPLADLDLRLDLKPVRLAHLTSLNKHFLKHAPLKITKGSAKISAQLRMSTATNKVSGCLIGTAKNIGMTLAGSIIETDVDLLFDLAEKNSEVGLNFSHLSLWSDFHPRLPQTQGWWAKVLVSKARLSLGGKKNSFSGVAHIQGKDGKPLLLALMNSGAVPNDLTTMTSMRELSITSDMKIERHIARFNDIQLHSTTLQAQGAIELKNNKALGKMKVQHPLHDFEVNIQ